MDVTGKKITVLGAARSGVAAAVMLANKGADVFVSDAGNPVRNGLVAVMVRPRSLNVPAG